jgi:hypothetical protein
MTDIDFRPLKADDANLTGYSRPEMMAIGDSIFNGTRSLSTGPGLAQISVPAMVARGLGLVVGHDFITPTYPRYVLFDLEQHLRQGLSITRLQNECIANAESWVASGGVWSQKRFFDNISIAGAEYKDLIENTSGYFKSQILMLLDQLKHSSGFNPGVIANLYYAINAAFLLNPSGDPDLDDLTPLEQVASRKPKRLLINIGSNNGLFGIGVTANIARAGGDGVTLMQKIKEIPGQAKILAQFLHSYCADIEHIYFNLLIRPRALANLAPATDEEMWNPPPDGGYFPRYVGRLGSLNNISAKGMEELDNLVASVNSATVANMTGVLGGKIHFIDLHKWVGDYDRKHGTEKHPINLILHGRDARLSNYPLSVNLVGNGFRHGGLFSLDNMHPTTPGYALIANEIGKEIKSCEIGRAFTPISSQIACDQDTLLQELPVGWDFLNFIAGFFAAFIKV